MTTTAIIGTAILGLLIAVIIFDSLVSRSILSPQEEADLAEELKSECLDELEETKINVARQKLL